MTNWCGFPAERQARSIGVANFTRRHLKEILSSCKEPPEVVQTEDRFFRRRLSRWPANPDGSQEMSGVFEGQNFLL